MKTKQYSVKICEVNLTDNKSFITFFDTYYNLFKDHIIVINGELNDEIKEYLDSKELKFLVGVKLPKNQGRKAIEEELKDERIKYNLAKEQFNEELKKLKNIKPSYEKEKSNLKVSDSLLRSGQELNIDGDLLLLNRVNSGASINIEGNLIVTQIVDGSIRCNGNFMMIKASKKANVVFNDVEVPNQHFKDRLSRVELIDNEIVITPVLKETNWGV